MIGIKVKEGFELHYGNYILAKDFKQAEWQIILEYIRKNYSPLHQHDLPNPAVVGFNKHGQIGFFRFPHKDYDTYRVKRLDVLNIREIEEHETEVIKAGTGRTSRILELVKNRTPYELANMYINVLDERNKLQNKLVDVAKTLSEGDER